MKRTQPSEQLSSEESDSQESSTPHAGEKRLRGDSESPEVTDSEDGFELDEPVDNEDDDVIQGSDSDDEAAAGPAKVEETNEENMPFPKEQEKVDAPSDDSEDDEVLIRTGNIPEHWYDEYDHVGYDVKGSKVKKIERDELEEFLRRQKDPEWWREIEDKMNNRRLRLSKEDLELIQKVKKGQFADGLVDPYDTSLGQVEFENPDTIHPMNDIKPKRRFIRSLNERNQVNRYIQAIKRGWLKVRTKEEIENELKQKKERTWDVWQDESLTTWKPRKMPPTIQAPKKDPPTHAESYNPSKEYLLDEQEKKDQEDLDEEDRMYNFEPQVHDALRKVPLYENLVKEHFERCLDLYLAPRALKKKVNIAASSLIPEIPPPSELKPFPTKVSVSYKGHSARVRSLSVSPCGNYLATGDEEGNVFIFHVRTSRIRQKYTFGGCVDSVEWSPNRNMPVLAVVSEQTVTLIVPRDLFDGEIERDTQKLFNQFRSRYIAPTTSGDKKPACVWTFPDRESTEFKEGRRVVMTFEHLQKRIVWHLKGDYFATLADRVQTSSSVLIHSLSKTSSQKPFAKSKGIVEAIEFHPVRPLFYVSNTTHVFIYNLQKQSLTKKFQSGARAVSSLAIHPKGDHFVVGSFDKRMMWFDQDTSSLPYKKLKYHSKAIRNVDFSKKYPLFVSCSDDGSLNIFHGFVSEDPMINPLIVPVKVLKGGHKVKDNIGVLDCQFHPTQPWVFSSGADGQVHMWS